jgi:predicted LPLAT superfamily acyltransferase
MSNPPPDQGTDAAIGKKPDSKHWAQQERGAPFMMRLMLWMAFKMGRRGVRWILYPTVTYFLIAAPRAVRASRNCLRRLLQRAPTWPDVTKHLFYFASCTQDRIFLLSNQHHELKIDAFWSPDIPEVLAHTPGCILMVGHVGSREALRLTPPPPAPDTTNMQNGKIVMRDAHTRAHESLPVSVLFDRQVGRQMTELFEKLNPQLAANIIDASERGPTLVLKLKEALQSGRMVGIGADRATGDERAVTVQFMGGTVNFPEGPWTLAAALGVPVILGFGLYCGANRYEAHFELFSERIVTSRQNRHADIQAHAQRYAQRMEHYARMSPYNWFNFYDYWLEDAAASESSQVAS